MLCHLMELNMIIKQIGADGIQTDKEGVRIFIDGHSVQVQVVDDMLAVRIADASVVVEKNVPRLPWASRSAVELPFGDLEVGDSFSVPMSEKILQIGRNGTERNAATQAMREKARQFRERPGNEALKFSIREMKGEGVIRCWRVA